MIIACFVNVLSAVCVVVGATLNGSRGVKWAEGLRERLRDVKIERACLTGLCNGRPV
jgi:hypothetical protein